MAYLGRKMLFYLVAVWAAVTLNFDPAVDAGEPGRHPAVQAGGDRGKRDPETRRAIEHFPCQITAHAAPMPGSVVICLGKSTAAPC